MRNSTKTCQPELKRAAHSLRIFILLVFTVFFSHCGGSASRPYSKDICTDFAFFLLTQTAGASYTQTDLDTMKLLYVIQCYNNYGPPP